MGEWVYKKSRDHVCSKPSTTTGVTTGDIYRCDCGKLWRVKRKGFDQRDNASWLEWTEHYGAVPEQKTAYAVNKLTAPHVPGDPGTGGDTSGIYAPGTK